jgi:RNA polymerase-binding transcription factor DksA
MTETPSTNYTPSKIYVSSRYTLNQLHQYRQQQQLQMEQEESLEDSCETTAKQHHQQLRHDHQLQQQLEQQGLSLRVIERDDVGNLVQSGQPLSFARRGMDHHTYDVPLPAKWV